MGAPTFDLQSHSTHSDGELPPERVVARAASEGVELLALSDHDTVAGVPAAQRAAREHGLKLSPAVEISAIDPLHADFHILGYEIDPADAALEERLAAFRADREGRGGRMAERLQQLGFALKAEHLDRGDRPLGRPHLAAAVFEHPANATRLRDEGLTDPGAVLEAYLIEGAPGFVRRTLPTVPQAIQAIHDAGGVAVWAHPFWDLDDPGPTLEALERFVAHGIDGVEAFYVTHTQEQTALLADAADRHDLLTTGSADFHGPGHRTFSRFRAFELHGREPRLGPIGS
ncbi:MAG TPA: PHP domain-containing protein [Solirubrobacteraceae bacterium]